MLVAVTQYDEKAYDKIEKLSTRLLKGERACIRGSKYVLFEFLD